MSNSDNQTQTQTQPQESRASKAKAKMEAIEEAEQQSTLRVTGGKVLNAAGDVAVKGVTLVAVAGLVTGTVLGMMKLSQRLHFWPF